MILIHKNKKFNDEKIKYIKIIVEQFALILGNISLYNELKKTANINLEFLVSISHEFKTPLNSIIGFSEILQEQTDDKNTFNKLKNIKYSSTHLLSIIQDVLDIAKSDNKKLEINKNIFNPQKVILEILNTLELQIKAKNINLTYTLLDMELNADERRFKQLLYNLFSNAIKYNKPNGSINIIIYKENKNFVLEISDTGEGIAEKDQKKIFNFFTQTSANYLNRETGSGVGLALCKRIVDAHKGKIGFKSVLNKGSTFYFKLPNN